MAAAPVVLEAEPIITEPQQALYVPETPAGTVATLNVSKNAGRAPSTVTVIVPEPEPEVTGTFKLSMVNGVPTMTSLEIVAYINYLRKQAGNDTELQHKHFLAKVMEVLKKYAAKFSSTSFYDVYGKPRSRPIYVFPERETMLMVMSYDIDMQATMYDAWDEAA